MWGSRIMNLKKTVIEECGSGGGRAPSLELASDAL